MLFRSFRINNRTEICITRTEPVSYQYNRFRFQFQLFIQSGFRITRVRSGSGRFQPEAHPYIKALLKNIYKVKTKGLFVFSYGSAKSFLSAPHRSSADICHRGVFVFSKWADLKTFARGLHHTDMNYPPLIFVKCLNLKNHALLFFLYVASVLPNIPPTIDALCLAPASSSSSIM